MAELPVGGFAERDSFVDDARHLVDRAAEQVFGPELPRSFQIVVRYGHPPQVLVDESRTAGMLVLGRHGHRGFLGLSLGSVSDACATHAHCPVLIVSDHG